MRINNYEQSEYQLAICKRERFRQQIRRKAINQYQYSIRRQYQKNNENIICQQSPMNINKLINLRQHQTSQDSKQSCQVVCKSERSIFHEDRYLIAKEMDINLVHRVEEISLSQSQLICSIEVLGQIEQIIENQHIQSIKYKLEIIFDKICVSYQYWSSQFLEHLFILLVKMQRRGMDISSYLQSLTQCSLIEKKITIYHLLIKTRIIDTILTQAYYKQNTINLDIRTKLIKTIQNLISNPPIVNHQHQNYYQLNMSSSYCISYLINILTSLMIINIKFPIIGNASQLQIKNYEEKQLFNIINIVYSMLYRLDRSQIKLVIQSMRQKNWCIFQAIINSFIIFINKKENNQRNSNIEIKLKYKIMLICLCILESNQCKIDRKVKLQFLYIFLPTLMKIIDTDLHCLRDRIINNEGLKNEGNCCVQIDHLNKNGCKYNNKYQNQLERKYSSSLVEVICTILSIQDELQSIPALDFICLGYNDLFECIYDIYFCEPVHLRKFHIMSWMTEQLLNQLPNACNFVYLSVFVQDVIIGYQCQQNHFILRQIVETVLQHFRMYSRDKRMKSHHCLLLERLSKNTVMVKLENLANEIEDIDLQLSSNIDNLHEVLQQNMKNII